MFRFKPKTTEAQLAANLREAANAFVKAQLACDKAGLTLWIKVKGRWTHDTFSSSFLSIEQIDIEKRHPAERF